VLYADDPERAAALADALLAADGARWLAVRDEHRAFTLAEVLADTAARSSRPTAPSGRHTCPSTPRPRPCSPP
jgi:hypothetical protein